MPTALIVLAAGQGSRMQSDLPKVLHRVGHAPLLIHALRAGDALAPERVVVVTGPGGEAVGAAALEHDESIIVVRQDEPLGTGHAVLQARAAMEGFEGDAIVLYGDTPFVRPETLEAMLALRADGADVVVLGFETADPGRYGRIVAEGDRLDRIVEARDAGPEELAIRLCNSGVLAADAGLLFDLLGQVGRDNSAGEYYLTDVPALARAARLSARVVTCAEAETLGVNTRADLAEAEAAFQRRMRDEALATGATLTAPETVFFAFDTVIGRDVTIEPNVVFGPGATVESGATIRAFSHLEGCHVSEGCVVGPFARLRPGAELDRDVRVGNFVEVKAATVARGREAQPPFLYRRCGDRGARECGRGHHHLQLRRRLQVSHGCRRGCLHRIEHGAGRAGADRGRGDDRVGQRRDDGRARRRAGAGPGAAGQQGGARPADDGPAARREGGTLNVRDHRDIGRSSGGADHGRRAPAPRISRL